MISRTLFEKCTDCHLLKKKLFEKIDLQSDNYSNKARIIILFTRYYPEKK